jgi:hypothetical protein
MPIVGRKLKGDAFSVPLKAAEIPKAISWIPGVSRSSFAPPSNKVAPEASLAPAPSVRNKPSKPVPFVGTDLLLTRSDHRVVAVDVLAIDRREKHRLAGIVRVLTEYLNVLATGPRPKRQCKLDACLPPGPG